MVRSMVLDSRHGYAYVHDSYRSTNDARGAKNGGSVNRCGLRLAAAYRRSLEAEPEGVDAQKAHRAILVGPDESML